jgi:excisionase family DNA binding protein
VTGADQPGRLLTPQEVAEILGLKASTVYELCRTRRLGHVRLGRRALRITQEQLDRFVSDSAVPPREW